MRKYSSWQFFELSRTNLFCTVAYQTCLKFVFELRERDMYSVLSQYFSTLTYECVCTVHCKNKSIQVCKLFF